MSGSRPEFLIDDCLSIRLLKTAAERGYSAAYAREAELDSTKDKDLFKVVEETGMVLVTGNTHELGPAYDRESLNAGVILIRPVVSAKEQDQLFRAALDDLVADSDLKGSAMDVDFEGWQIVIRRYRLP